jgi:TatD DNase family protein
MLETDSPDMPLNHFQGQRNSPSQLPLVAKALSELKAIPVEAVKEQTTLNYSHLFKVSV